jgi:hypothetical protein
VPARAVAVAPNTEATKTRPTQDAVTLPNRAAFRTIFSILFSFLDLCLRRCSLGMVTMSLSQALVSSVSLALASPRLANGYGYSAW